MLLHNFLCKSNNVERDSLIWNMVGSCLNAFQSVIMLMILTRFVNLNEAGIFTIAYASANLFLNIGKYGIRNFQVSDVNSQFSFSVYHMVRIVTTLLMIFVSLGYVLAAGWANQYAVNKILCIFFMCMFKTVDSMEDVYHGCYQQQGRLDIAGKCLSLRMFLTILLFGLCIVLFRSLLLPLIISTIFTCVLAVYLIQNTKQSFLLNTGTGTPADCADLIKMCFPLFLGSFLMFYIGNAPKYAIDSLLNDEIQACYGFIAMPIFVIELLNNFIFNPIIAKMSKLWSMGNKKEFLRLLFRQLFIIIGITAVCIIGAYLIGIPVLTFLYHTDLTGYKDELIILLAGGGLLALSGLLVTVITIMRRQKYIVYVYLVVALLNVLTASTVVRDYSVRGASAVYFFSMLFLCIGFFFILICGLVKEDKNK